MRRTSLGAGLVAVCILLSGCGTVASGPGAEAERGEQAAGPGSVRPERALTTIRVGLGRDPISIDPRDVSDDEGELIVRALFDGLVDVAPDGSVVPAAATWTTEPDGLTYRFELRDDRFHDGSPVTAQDHADALLAVFDPGRAPRFREDLLARLRGATVVEGAAQRWGLPEDILTAGGVEVIGDRELVLRLERPDPLLLHRLADVALVPLPAMSRDDPAGFAREPIGNGPYRMLGPREPGAFIRLRASTVHPRIPAIDELVFQVYPDDVDRSQRWADLLIGRLQITAVPVERRAEARELFGAPITGRTGPGLHDLPLMGLYAYGFVLDVPPFDDVDLRRAISAAIDREALAAELATAGVEPATAILPPSAGGEPPGCAHCRHDPELAAASIAAWRERLPDGAVEPVITLTYPRGGGHVSAAELIASDLETFLGVEVRLQSREFGALVRGVTAGEAPLFRYGLRASLGGDAAAVSLLDDALRSESPGNWIRWRDLRTDRQLDAWTPVAGAATARDIEAAVLDQAAIVPLLWTRADLVVHPDVVGFRADPTGRWWPELLRLR